MKLKDHFSDFLANTVNLNVTRVGQLEKSVDALQTFIGGSDWGPAICGFGEQGSWAHKTIIKPQKDKLFDADFLIYVDPVKGWDAKTYLTEMRRVFAASKLYEDKVRRYSHCVTIEYAGERKIDIAPVVVNRGAVGGEEVCNFNDNAFERTAPGDYTKWLVDRNGWTGTNGLRKATRLLKYLRDIKTTFTCPSVLLTTLLGMQITSADAKNDTDFTDPASALRTIVGRLDDWLQARASRPTVTNPVLSSETLSSAWDDTKYANFRAMMNQYRGWIDDAYAEQDRDESIGKWRRVFGDDFAKSVVVERAAKVSETALLVLKETRDITVTGFNDLVSAFRSLGRRAIPPFIDRLPHKQRPRWRTAPTVQQFSVTVEARLHATRNGIWLSTLEPDHQAILQKGRWLEFRVRTRTGLPLAGDYDLHWRIANTDSEAYERGQLRGGFEKANDGSSHWEELSYRGVHTAEAFVVRKRDNQVVAQSAPFYVVIE